MHDPSTVAFEIRWPIEITIWHEDPQTDGTDDSCGWFKPKYTEEQRRKVLQDAECHASSLQGIFKVWDDSNRLEIIYDIYRLAKWNLYRQRLNAKDYQEILDLALNTWDNIKVHGPASQEEYDRMILNMGRIIMGNRRPWWRHPRWHIHHWRIQVHCIQRLKRWLFSRCEACGGRFAWGEHPITNRWHGTGPLWFRSEQGVFHQGCYYTRLRGGKTE